MCINWLALFQFVCLFVLNMYRCQGYSLAWTDKVVLAFPGDWWLLSIPHFYMLLTNFASNIRARPRRTHTILIQNFSADCFKSIHLAGKTWASCFLSLLHPCLSLVQILHSFLLLGHQIYLSSDFNFFCIKLASIFIAESSFRHHIFSSVYSWNQQRLENSGYFEVIVSAIGNCLKLKGVGEIIGL